MNANLIHQLLSTDNNIVLMLIRIVLGVVIFPHGAQKLFGWFGGHGWNGSMNFFKNVVGVPYLLGAISILTESVLAVFLIAGFFTRVAALAILINMIVAATMHFKNGFFMNWNGNSKGEGYEYHLLTFALSIALIIGGGGMFSLDSLL
jgi:putative oxidoreductase